MDQRAGQEQNADQPTSDVEKKASDLKKLLDDQTAKPKDIQEALKALRDARAKTKTDLADAQKDLRGVVNLRQESFLVLMGLLE